MVLSIKDVIDVIKKDPECVISAPSGLPMIDDVLQLPDDVRYFYENCGGIVLHPDSNYSFAIVGPKEFVRANPVIVGEVCSEDISSMWYIVCRDRNNNFLTIDLSKKRNGKCYDSFWDRHGIVGECAVIANNFTELVYQLYRHRGECLFWLEEQFTYLGDAYDEF